MAKAKTAYRIDWRPMAKADLDTIIDNTWSFGQELRAKVLPLAQHPKLGRTGRPGLLDFVRELVAHRNYIIFYRVLDKARTVEILRVKHAAQKTP